MKTTNIKMKAGDKQKMVESVHWLERESPAEYYFFLMKRFLDETENKKLLDVGCAHRVETMKFRGFGFEAEGIDLNEDFIRAAKNNCIDCRFQVGSAENLPYKNAEFDVVFCINTLFFTSLEKSLPELVRVLKPNGIGVLSYDTEIQDLEKNRVMYASSIQLLEDMLQNCKIIYSEHKQRIDESPFKHVHQYFNIVFQKSELKKQK